MSDNNNWKLPDRPPTVAEIAIAAEAAAVHAASCAERSKAAAEAALVEEKRARSAAAAAASAAEQVRICVKAAESETRNDRSASLLDHYEATCQQHLDTIDSLEHQMDKMRESLKKRAAEVVDAMDLAGHKHLSSAELRSALAKQAEAMDDGRFLTMEDILNEEEDDGRQG